MERERTPLESDKVYRAEGVNANLAGRGSTRKGREFEDAQSCVAYDFSGPMWLPRKPDAYPAQ